MTNDSMFGFQPIEPEEKVGRIRKLFNEISGDYDLMNTLMSLGAHRLWKRTFVERMGPPEGKHLLDLASGSGDIASLFLKSGGTCVTLCDLSENMLRLARNRLFDEGFHNNLNFVLADAAYLPFSEDSFDWISLSFGLRNMSQKPQVLKECLRVLKPGGLLFCLEFSRPSSSFLSSLYRQYLFRAIPIMGRYVAENEEAYRYLAESIDTFYTASELKDLFSAAGFIYPTFQTLWNGIIAIHRGQKNKE